MRKIFYKSILTITRKRIDILLSVWLWAKRREAKILDDDKEQKND